MIVLVKRDYKEGKKIQVLVEGKPVEWHSVMLIRPGKTELDTKESKVKKG